MTKEARQGVVGAPLWIHLVTIANLHATDLDREQSVGSVLNTTGLNFREGVFRERVFPSRSLRLENDRVVKCTTVKG